MLKKSSILVILILLITTSVFAGSLTWQDVPGTDWSFSPERTSTDWNGNIHSLARTPEGNTLQVTINNNYDQIKFGNRSWEKVNSGSVGEELVKAIVLCARTK